MPAYFVADVHLSPEAPDRSRLFIRFLDSLFPAGGTLYILGDLFDFWVGPKHADLPDHQAVLAKLRELASRGVPVRFIYGNRDFHFDARLARRFGMDVLGDEARIEEQGLKLLLVHGDLFCTNDRSYRISRALFRHFPVSFIFRSLPVSWSYAMAGFYRRVSRRKAQAQNGARRDLTDESVLAAFASGVDAIICGHGHVARVRTFSWGGADRPLYMLGSWMAGGSYLELRNGKFSLHSVT